jgi:hypothetical protein
MVWDFILDFFKVFVEGVISIFYTKNNSNNMGGVFGGIIEIFNINEYIKLFTDFNATNPSVLDWILFIIGIILVLTVLIGLIFITILLIKKILNRIFSKETNQDLIDEIARLRSDLKRSQKEKERLLKYRSIGKEKLLGIIDEEDKENHINKDCRFYKLIKIDEKYKNYNTVSMDIEYSLENICNDFRLFAAKELNLYYDLKTVRLFFSAFAVS